MRLAETRDCRGKRLLHTAQSQTSPNLLTLQRGLSGHGLLMTNILLTPNNAYLSLPQPAPQSLPWPSPRLLCPIQATLHPWPCQQPGGTAAIVVGKGAKHGRHKVLGGQRPQWEEMRAAEAVCRSALPWCAVSEQSLKAWLQQMESGWHRKPHLNTAVHRSPQHLNVTAK